MTQPAPTPPPTALAAAVRRAEWAQVRAVTDALPRPLSPPVALAAARAARELGEPGRALALLRAALPGAGPLAGAVRLEAGRAALATGSNPWPLLSPLLGRLTPAPQRSAAAALLVTAWQVRPLAELRRVRPAALPRALRRQLATILAARAGDRPAALRVVCERLGDAAARQAAAWLATQPLPAWADRLDVAEALLAAGAWREAAALLAERPPPQGALHSRWAFLTGRAAYRLGDLAAAATAFDDARATAGSDAERFAAAVQRARIAELTGTLAEGLACWDAARAAAPREVEGWDGGARLRLLLGRADEAATLLAHAPAAVRRVAVPRLAALLLARGDTARARSLLATLPRHLPVARALWVAVLARDGEVAQAREVAAAALADPRVGAWREMIAVALPAAAGGAPVAPSRDPVVLARIAAERGAQAATGALAAALAPDPTWGPLLAGAVVAPQDWDGPAAALAAVGLEHDAAELYAATFPAATATDLAWSAAHLAAWGNPAAALNAGERLWRQVGDVPAVMLPPSLQRLVLPPRLVGPCAAAARAAALPAPWLIGIVRQESRFDEHAFSPAGAIGMAQIVPETARALGAEPADLSDPVSALRLAAREMNRLTARFGPHLAVVAAAYNAGDRVVATWLSELGGEPAPLVFAAAVPYRETASYVLQVCQGAALAAYLTDQGAVGGVATGATGTGVER